MRTLAGGETFGDRFEIVGEAGRGGMGVVFEAIDRTTGERVALKIVTSGADKDRFTREAVVLESLVHLAIVRYVCHGVSADGHPYLAMEWLRGESLSARLKRGKLAVTDAVLMAERIAGALAHAHAAGVVHRDLKPSNVYLRDGAFDRAVLIDFGVAKTDDKNLTTTGQMIGTPGYMAPEQVRGDRGVDQRVDVFALGCVLYEAIAGKAPFDGGEVMEVLSRLLLEKPAPLDIPPRLAHLLDAMIVKDARFRIADCAIVREELATIAAALATDNRDTLRRRSPSIPPPPPETMTSNAPSFPLHTTSKATVAEPGAARIPGPGYPDLGAERPSSHRLTSRTAWIAIAILGAIIGGAVGAYLVLGKSDAVTPPPVEPTPVVVKPEPVCKPDDRTDCAVLCERGNAKACRFHGEGLVAGNRSRNRKPAIDAFTRACELGELVACSDAAEQMIAEGATADDIKRAYALLHATCVDKADLEACRFLAEQFRFGGAWENVSTAIKLFGEYCSKGNDGASCAMLREMIEWGEGTPADAKTATAHLAAACKSGIKDACL